MPYELIECFGPVGQDGSLASARARFGSWRRSATQDVWLLHNKQEEGGIGFSYRGRNADIAMYPDIPFQEFKRAFIEKDQKAVISAHSNAIYGDWLEGEKYLGVALLRMLNNCGSN